jgi:putative phosphoserine phosphatase/1-acylglycerol-3-phosphate O-acyltransferase
LEVDLAGSFAYADSISDLPLLELVGHPTAVYPDEQLAVEALERHWSVLNEA